MSIEEQLKNEILEQFKSVRAFTLNANIPYSTIDTMLKKGISGTSVTTVIKVCKLLKIDVEELLSGHITYKIKQNHNLSSYNAFNDDEQNLIKKYRELTPKGQETVCNLIDTLSEKPQHPQYYTIEELQSEQKDVAYGGGDVGLTEEGLEKLKKQLPPQTRNK